MKTTNIIEEYLDNTLSKEDREAVEARLATDKDFRDLLALHKEVNESIGDKDFKEFHRLLEKVSSAYFKRDIEKFRWTTRLRRNLLRIAAILILIAASGITLKSLFFDQAKTEKLFKKYYETYDPDIISRSAQSETDSLELAIIRYLAKEYPQSMILLDNIVEREAKNYPAWFYRGLSCLETDQISEAIRSFRSIPDSWNSPYREHRDWYLALSLLRKGDIAGASMAFMAISSANGYYAHKAGKLYLRLAD